MTGANNQNQEKLLAAQQSYETSAHTYHFIKNAKKTIVLKTLFGVAAVVIGTFVFPESVLPLAVLNGALIYDAYKNRANNMRLAAIFNEVTGEMTEEARSHLRPIANELKTIEPIDFKDLNPKRHLEERPLALFLTGGSLLFAPAIVPAMAAALIAGIDHKKFIQIVNAAEKVKNNMERLYPALKDPQPPRPDA